jgi:hypothetical protein
MMILLIPGQAEGYSPGEVIKKLDVEGFKWQYQSMRGEDVYAMDKEGNIYEYKESNNYDEKKYNNAELEGVLEAIAIHENGTMYYMERRETIHYVVGCNLNGTKIYENEIETNINTDDGTHIMNMIINEQFLMINDADYELEIYNHDMELIRIVELDETEIEGEFTHGIVYDGEDYWLPTTVMNTFKTDNQARFYKVSGETGEVKMELKYDPIFTSVMSISEGNLYYVVMELDDYSDTIYRVELSNAEDISHISSSEEVVGNGWGISVVTYYIMQLCKRKRINR